jgi:hypothetical protein
MKRILLVIWTFGLLAACGETPQTMGNTPKSDTAAFQGTGVAPFAAKGWKEGDKVSWEQQLKTRTQSGQNEFTKLQ